MKSNVIKIAVLVALSLGAIEVSFAGGATSAKLKEISLLSEQGNQGAALDKVDAYLASNPKDAEALFMKGVILVELGKRDDAINAFTDLTQKYPNLPEPYNNLAVLYADKGQYDKARQALESAIKTHPSYATAHENLGDIYARLASDAYGKAFKLDTSNSRAQSKLAMITDLFGGSKVLTAPSATNVVAPVVATKPAVVATPEPVKTAAVEKPVDVKKAEPVKAAEPANNNDEVVLDAVKQWAKAWSKQDVNQYLASYASSFKPGKGQSRKDWEALRRQRVSAPSKISVDVGSPKVTFKGSDEAKVVFYQTYRANGSPQSTSKTLMMTRQGNNWLIEQELIGVH
jgi:cytochrome c-type biogenesis protein CcmH/NrfG